MQKLETRNTYTPLGASQALGNCDSVIKHGQHSVQVLQSLKTVSNNSDVNRQSGKTGHNLSVYVVNLQKKPLMPCCPGKARRLLNENEAKVVSRKPFTIQLLETKGTALQEITLGIDAGYQKVGVSAVSDKKELFSAEVTLRTDIPKKLQNRAMYRRQKRNKLWHRKPRFLNRGISEGWLAPSIQHKLDSHIRIVEKVKKILPISEVIVEVASFDVQKIKNPDIEGEEYQQGEQLGFWNIREYVLHRDNHTCQHCKGKKKDKILQVHHINGKAEGATDRPEELLTVCKTCHDEHHKGVDIIPKKKIKNFKPESFMTTVRWKIVNTLGCKYTYGHITKHNRIKQGLGKSHINDAFIIAGGTVQKRSKPYVVKQVRRNNRCLQLNRKGFKPSIRRRHYSLQFQILLKI
jgi:cytochrome c553